MDAGDFEGGEKREGIFCFAFKGVSDLARA